MAGLRLASLGVALLLAACASQPRPTVVPPRSAPPPAIVPPSATLDWRDLPLSRGHWRYRGGPSGSEALFGEPDAAPELVLRCQRAERKVVIARTTAAGPLTVRTSYSTRTLPTGGGGASLAAADPFLDQIAFSRGRVTVAADGIALLVVPSWAEPARVIEDCRN